MEKNEVFEAEDLLTKKENVGHRVKKFKIPIRFWIGCMVFFTTYTNYTTRSNINISVPAMVTGIKGSKVLVPECLKKEDINVGFTPAAGNGTVPVPKKRPDYGPRYDWDEGTQARVLGSYFWGYTISSLPAGWLAESVGPFRVIFWTHVITLILNVCSVFAAQLHFGALICTRFLIGLCAGFVYPALQCLIARWAPPAEKGKFVGALMGNTLGTCVTLALVGAVTQKWGWDWGFYMVSLEIAVFCVVFFFVAADSPEQHKWITEEEKTYIAESQAGSVNKQKAVPPYRAIFTSIPFWVLAVLHWGNLWGLYLQLTGVPKFMVEVIGFNLKESGFLSALPTLTRLFFGLGFGILGDYVKTKGCVSNKFARKFFVLFSHIIPGILLIAIFLVGCDWVPILAMLVFSQAINGAAVLTNLQNAQDLAPNFAGTIFGIISCIGGLTGFVAPEITGAFISGNNGIKEWGNVFILGGCMYVGCGLIFILFGSVERQKWNEKKEQSSPT